MEVRRPITAIYSRFFCFSELAGEVLETLTLNAGANAAIDFGATEEALDTVVINVFNGAAIDSTISGNAGDEYSLTSLTLTDGSEDGDGAFDIKLENTVNLTSITLSGGAETDIVVDAGDDTGDDTGAAFSGAVTINVGAIGVDDDGNLTNGLEYRTNKGNGIREVFKFVGENIGNVEIVGFLAGVGANADRLNFSAFDGVGGLDDLDISYDGSDTTITSDAFDGAITVLGVDLSTDAFNFIF